MSDRAAQALAHLADERAERRTRGLHGRVQWGHVLKAKPLVVKVGEIEARVDDGSLDRSDTAKRDKPKVGDAVALSRLADDTWVVLSTHRGDGEKAPKDFALPAGGPFSFVENADGDDELHLAVVFQTPHAWVVGGVLHVGDFIPPFYPLLAAGQSAKVARARAAIHSGTSVTLDVKKNGSGVTGLTGLVVTTSVTTTDPADVAVADGDELAIAITAAAGSPSDLSFTLALEHTVGS